MSKSSLHTHYGSLKVLKSALPEVLTGLQDGKKSMDEVAGTKSATVFDYGFIDCVSEADGFVKKGFQELRSGDMLTMFNTITDGKICYEGVIEAGGDHDPKEAPQGIERHVWADILHDRCPVKLETQNGTHFGTIATHRQFDYFFWVLKTFGSPFSRTVGLEKGAKLTAYDYVIDGDIDFEGRLSFSPKKLTAKEYSMSNVRQIFAREVHHEDTNHWLLYSMQNRPVKIQRSTPKFSVVGS